jgi:nucleoside phosphorylase/tetratricopeptide (TPR) repeat protein
MGKASAASATASLRSSYPGVRLVLVTGICGGVPRAAGTGEEMVLGDVVISKTVVQYDLGRRYPDGFVTKDTVEDSLGKPDKNIRSLVTIFETDLGRERLEKRTAAILQDIQNTAARKGRGGKYRYPGAAQDKLFLPEYQHKHRLLLSTCLCAESTEGSDGVCQESRNLSCDEIGCDDKYLVRRGRLETNQRLELDDGNEAQSPAIFVGRIASGDSVLKSGEHRDMLAKRHGIIAFEMEGAGIWDEIPCIVVKGVCDYADSHKKKKWQDFAAAMAASATKALLERYSHTGNQTYMRTDSQTHNQTHSHPAHWTVPFGRNGAFVGRQTILSRLLEKIPPNANKDDCQWTVIEGLGGVGKTQIALEAAFRLRDQDQHCSVFWMPVVDATIFETAYREIGRKLQIHGIENDNADVKALVKATLSDERAGQWLLVIDNADDSSLLFGDPKDADGESLPLLSYLPSSPNGSILFTTRHHDVAVALDIPWSNTITVNEMSDAESLDLFKATIPEELVQDTESTMTLLNLLVNLPLAIRQASAYMTRNSMSTTQYLEIYQESDQGQMDLLSEDFNDRHRYKNIRNPVATTWLISFRQISEHNPLAADYLRFICFLAEKDIPLSLLPPAPKRRAAEAIGTLKAYAFLTARERDDSYDIHRLVQVAARNWLRETEEWPVWATKTLQRIAEAFPFPEHENREIWVRFLPHAQNILQLRGFGGTDEDAEYNLLFNVAESFWLLGKYQYAEAMHRQALMLKEKVLGSEHPSTLDSMNNLALVLDSQGKYEEAEAMHRQALMLKEKVLGREHPSTLDSMNNLAIVLDNQGKYDDAEAVIKRRGTSTEPDG